MTKTYQLVGIGNAVVDVIAQCEDSFLSEQGIEKGIMQLIERERCEDLYAAMGNRVLTPGRLGRQYHRGRWRAGAGSCLYRPCPRGRSWQVLRGCDEQ